MKGMEKTLFEETAEKSPYQRKLESHKLLNLTKDLDGLTEKKTPKHSLCRLPPAHGKSRKLLEHTEEQN